MKHSAIWRFTKDDKHLFHPWLMPLPITAWCFVCRWQIWASFVVWLCSVFRIIKGQGIDIKSLSSRSVLTVTNMTEDRYGNYTCVASNKLGTANASVPLIRKLSFYLLDANWSGEVSEDWKSVVAVSEWVSALRGVCAAAFFVIGQNAKA